MVKINHSWVLTLISFAGILLCYGFSKVIDDGEADSTYHAYHGDETQRRRDQKNSSKQENYEETIDGYQIKMVAIPGGVFQMGSSENDPHHQPEEGPLHQVEVDGFWLSSVEVTWDLYEKFLNREMGQEVFSPQVKDLGIEVDGISGATTPYIDMSNGMGKDGFPVTNVTQHAALTFCKWLSAKTGHFYRLPTEAEWEYACKKGVENEEVIDLSNRAWTKENSARKYQKVGTKAPNALGIYDMLGNVAEWTMDQYQPDFYSKSAVENPWAVPDQLYPRTLRGGSWKDQAEKCSCTARKKSKAKWKMIDPQLPKSKWWFTNAPYVGFRILRPFETPSIEEIDKYWLNPIDDY